MTEVATTPTSLDLLDGEVAALRTCADDGTSHNGFKWPLTLGAVVEAPDWSSEACCGKGLHGLLRGVGDGTLLKWAESAKWMVVAVQQSEIVDLDGKVKFPRCRIVHIGDRFTASALLKSLYPNEAVAASTATAGDGGTATAGDGGTATAGTRGTATAGTRGTATAGYGGTATAGDGGTATAGDGGTATAGYGGTATAGTRGTATAGTRGTATAGYGGTATAGDGGTATAGDGGTATAGYGGTATAGTRGTATAGYGGTATAGYGGTATAGDGGTATAGDGGTATAGDGGTVSVRFWKNDKERIVIGYVGEDGIEPSVPYVVQDGKLVRAPAQS